MFAWPSARIPIHISEGWNLITKSWIGRAESSNEEESYEL